MAIEKLKEKDAWKLYAGANDVEFEKANEISKAITKYNEKLKYASEEDREFINIEDYIPSEYIDLYRESLEYQGITINAKAHACGFLILDKDIRREIGLIRLKSESTGKSTLCVAMEGGYLDSFGYVKNDFLIVDSVGLTHRFFKSIGREVPSFDELREMIKDDKPTWDIYEKGITCCINQCEKPSTTRKCMEYKMTNLAESSAFIAGIRPGFKSLIKNFLKRIPYSTGVEQLDELLKDSYGYLLYQESIMKLLSYLGLPMGQCYETIKSISKKKFKEKELKALKEQLKAGWINKIGNDKLDKFEETWETVDNFAKYGFNSPHSLSMGGDSAYGAWFKAHHTSKFYEEAINHYQEKEKANKDKINELTREAIERFGYKLGKYQFGLDNRKVTVDDNTKIIYPNLSNIKGFGKKVPDILYELGKGEYNDFIDVLKVLKLDRDIITSLIKIDYFSEYGKSAYLLDIFNLYKTIYTAKTIKKDKIKELGISEVVLRKHCKETAKQYSINDNEGLVKDLIKYIDNREIPLKDKFKTEIKLFGYISTTIEESDKLYYVLKVDSYKNKKSMSFYTTLYNVKTGEEVRYRVTDYLLFMDYPFQEGDIIKIIEEDKKIKSKNIGTDEKPQWVKVEGEYNNMLNWWEIY